MSNYWYLAFCFFAVNLPSTPATAIVPAIESLSTSLPRSRNLTLHATVRRWRGSRWRP
jgi:hypothetical protein